MIKVEKEIILALADPLNFAQVTRLKLRIEEDCLVVNVPYVKWFGRIYQFLWFKVRSNSLTFY